MWFAGGDRVGGSLFPRVVSTISYSARPCLIIEGEQSRFKPQLEAQPRFTSPRPPLSNCLSHYKGNLNLVFLQLSHSCSFKFVAAPINALVQLLVDPIRAP